MVLKPEKEFLQHALTNNSFDIGSTNDALISALDHSFSYLYRLQRNLELYEELFYTTRNVIDQPDFGDYYMDYRERICVNFPIQLILPHGREKFRNSKYYKKKISYQELKTDHTMFSRFPVIIIDNHVLRDFEVSIFDDHFTAHLPFDRYFLHTKKFDKDRWEYEFVDHTTSVQVMDNSFYEDLSTNSGMLQRNSYGGTDFDRILRSYIKDSGIDLNTAIGHGTFFAVIYFGDEKLGTNLQEIVIDENGDFIVHYDKTVKDALRAYTGPLTVRFLFYRNCHKYTSYRDDGRDISKTAMIREYQDAPLSDIILIRDKEKKLYKFPIPTENFMLFRIKKENVTVESWGEMEHFPNANLQINYPNIYRIGTGDIKVGDRMNIYYFYIPPYDLYYSYMYYFYYNYLTYKWRDMDLEEIVNALFFGEIDLHEEGLFEKLNWALYGRQALLSGDEEIIEEVPDKVKDFLRVFDFVINHDIVPYHYDEVDYVRNYENDITPFEYKVGKLKSFIKDDLNILHKYVNIQNKVGNKYEFSSTEVDLEKRYREVSEGGEKFSEPMYIFPVTKPNPDIPLASRIFINGFLCSSFVYESFEFTDYIYIPVDEVPEDAYFEIEVFPAYTQKERFTFTKDQPYVDIVFESGVDVTPTLSDLFFYYGKVDTFERIPTEEFHLELISTRYTYYTDAPNTIDIAREVKNGVSKKSYYYTMDGTYYDVNDIPDKIKNLTAADVSTKLSTGELVLESGYATSNLHLIVEDEDYVTYDLVALGESTINKDNKGMNCTFLTTIRISPVVKEDMLDKEITLAIAKRPSFVNKHMTRLSFPAFNIQVDNMENIEEYTRAFKNGRIISKNRYDYTKVNGILAIQTLEKMEKGSNFAIDITPYRNRLIYYTRRISSDLVDLRGFINKPFDNKYYEVYLNGRRLNRTNIYPISACEFKLAGCHSTYNLEIYEKDRDWEYYGLDFEDYYTLSDFIRESFMEDGLREHLIDDETGEIPPNDDTEEPEPWERELDLKSVYFEIFYYNRLIPEGFVSGDLVQFSNEEMDEKYKVVDEIYHVKNALGEDVLLLNPDWYYHGKDEHRWNVYLLGNPSLDNLDEEV